MLEIKSEKQLGEHSEADEETNQITRKQTVAEKLNGHDRVKDKDKITNDEDKGKWQVVQRKTNNDQKPDPTIKPTDNNSKDQRSDGRNDSVSEERRARWTKQERKGDEGKKRGRRR